MNALPKTSFCKIYWLEAVEISQKPIPTLCKLYSFHHDKPANFLQKIDTDSCFYHNIIEISQSQHRIPQVPKALSFFLQLGLPRFDTLRQSSAISSRKEQIFRERNLFLLLILYAVLSIFFDKTSKEQVFTDPMITTQNWGWLFKFKGQSFCSIL